MKNIFFKLLLGGACTILMTACAHHKDVRPGTDGVHRVLVTAEDGEQGARNAISQANHFCAEQKKSAAFLEEKQAYNGSMKEEDYKTAKTVAKVAQAAGGAVWVFGGKAEREAGGIVGLGGGIANGAIGNGYSVDMKFKCL